MQISNNYSASYNAFVKKDMHNTTDNTKSSFSDAVAAKMAEVDSNEVQKKTSAVLDKIGSQASDEVKMRGWKRRKRPALFLQCSACI